MFARLKSLVKRYDDFLDSMGIKPDEKRCCVPVVRFDPESESKTKCCDENISCNSEQESAESTK